MTNGPRRRSPSAASEVSSPVPVETPARSSVGGASQSWLQKSTPSTTRSSSPCTSTDRQGDDIQDEDDEDDEVGEDDDEDDGDGDGDGDDDKVSFNPRRFTPTLHASLVSEILNLRREVDSKTRTIDTLERNLDESRTECEDVGSNLSRCSKEARSLRHQLDLLEGGSSSALTELAKERDDALESINEMRKKLEYNQKKSRSREDDADRTQLLWDREREAWDIEKRSLERKVHVVENRLKTVLKEVAMAQAVAAGSSNNDNNNNNAATTFFDDNNDDGTTPKAENAVGFNSARDSDTASNYSDSQGHRRQISMASNSTNGHHNAADNRYSVVSMAYRHHGGLDGGIGDDGMNLAQELDFDNEEFDTLIDDPLIGEASPEALPEERPVSAHSQISQTMGAKARKVLGLGLQDRASSSTDSSDAPTEIPSPPPPGTTATRPSTKSMAFVYHDMGVQYSPPPSPTESTTPTLSPAPVTSSATTTSTSTPTPTPTTTTKDSATCTLTTEMVSSACQTIGDLPSPPWTPKIDKTDASFASFSSASSLPSSPTVATTTTTTTPAAPSISMVSSFTQTEAGPAQEEEQGQSLFLLATTSEEPNRMSLSPRDALSPPAPSGPGTGPGMEVPMIAIHPPGSEPPSPRGSVVLPPQTKSIACQTEKEENLGPVQGRSIAIQTEGIRVDPRRMMKLPASLMPSAIPNLPLANEASRSSTKEPELSSSSSLSSEAAPPPPAIAPAPRVPLVSSPSPPPPPPPSHPQSRADPTPPTVPSHPSLPPPPPPPLSTPPLPPSNNQSLPPEEPPRLQEKELPPPKSNEKDLPLLRSDKELPQLPVVESSRQETIQEEEEEEEEEGRPDLPPKSFETIGHIQAYPGNNDNGPLAAPAPAPKKLVKPGGGGNNNMRRPPRSSSLFAGFDDSDEEKPRRSTDKKSAAAAAAAAASAASAVAPAASQDIFNDDDLFNRPTATYTLRKGKMVSTPAQSSLDSTTLPEIEEHLSDAKMQLLNPDNDQPDPNDAMPSSSASRFRGMRSTSGSRQQQQQQNIRRAAMITNGAAAHQRIARGHNSDPSTDSGSNKSTTTSIAPPIPVPKRRSSRQFPSAANSESGHSGSNSAKTTVSDRSRPPTATSTRRSATTTQRNRSATTTSQGSQPDPYSPAMTMSSHGAAEIEGPPPLRPQLPWDNMPDPSVHAPRPQEYKRHSAWREIPVYEDPEEPTDGFDEAMGRERQDSSTTSIQQTSVVDAIAQTMVGEWMFKYIRRRSFTSGDKDNWEGRNAEEVSASITNTGMRHKRWVWLAPYERAIMWSNKQPSGSALLGKGGRKRMFFFFNPRKLMKNINNN